MNHRPGMAGHGRLFFFLFFALYLPNPILGEIAVYFPIREIG